MSEIQYQRLTRNEILQMAVLFDRLPRWHFVRATIREFYGERARFVIVSAASEEEAVPFHFEVQDAQHERCPVDVTLPWYTTWGKTRADAAQLTEETRRALGNEVHTAIQCEEALPGVPETYDLLRPPTLHGREPELYTLQPEIERYEALDFSTAARWSRDYQQGERWKKVSHAIRDLYGSGACLVSLATTSKEAGKAVMESVLVRNEKRQVIPPDVTLPWYREWLKKQDEDRQRRLRLLSPEEVRWEIWEEIEAHLLSHADLPVITAEYDLRYLPSAQPLPEIYRRSLAPFLPEEES